MSERLLKQWIRTLLAEATDDRAAVKLAQRVYGSAGATNTPLADMNEIIAAAALTKGSDVTSAADVLQSLQQPEAIDRFQQRLDQLEGTVHVGRGKKRKLNGVVQGTITASEKLVIVQNEINLGNKMAARIRTDAAKKYPDASIESGFWTGAAGAMPDSEYGTEDVIAKASGGVDIKYSLKRNKAAASTKGNPGLSDYNDCLPTPDDPNQCPLDMGAARMKKIADTLYPGMGIGSARSPNDARDNQFKGDQEKITATLEAAAKEIAEQLTSASQGQDIRRVQAAKNFVENAIEGDIDVDVVTPEALYSSSDPNNIVAKLGAAKLAGGNYTFTHDGGVGIRVSAKVALDESGETQIMPLFRVRLKYASANSGWGIKGAISESRTRGESRLRSLIRETILVEELTGADKKEIDKLIKKGIERDRAEQKRIMKKEIEAELKTSLGKSFFGNPGKVRKAIEEIARDELSREMRPGSELEKSVVEITKKVLGAWHEMLYKQQNIINRIRIK